MPTQVVEHAFDGAAGADLDPDIIARAGDQGDIVEMTEVQDDLIPLRGFVQE